ncbi:hypothetical protein AB8O53_29165, partial [Streptomyces pilosus]
MDDKPCEPRRRTRRRALLASVTGCAVLGGVLVLLPWGEGAPPAPTPEARARGPGGRGGPGP